MSSIFFFQCHSSWLEYPVFLHCACFLFYLLIHSEPRVVLLFDIWHPDIQQEERKRIIGMFEYAKGQGWIGNKQHEQ